MAARRSSRTDGGAGAITAPPPPSPRPRRGGIALRLGGLEFTTPDTRRDQVRRRRRFRRVRRLLGIAGALALLAVSGFTGLMLITPSVGNAPALVQALDRAHLSAYPGPPVPARFEAALVTAEDQRFYTEAGLSPAPMAGVLIGHLAGRSDQSGRGGPDQGATIAQKLARVLYLGTRSGLLADEEQILLGIKLTYSYSHAQILRMYADVMYFGGGYYGLAAASCGYFAERPAALSWAQAAILVAVAQAPLANDPVTHPANARAGEALVLAQLSAAGKLTSAQETQAFDQSLNLAPRHSGRGRC